jgi:L-ascorbate metabolism protein UlaG (beta-lactamase superfamily)
MPSRAALALALVISVACTRSAYPRSDHFDGEQFHNPSGEEPKSLGAVIRWKLTSFGRPDWHERAQATTSKPPARVGDGELRVTFVNHATMLLQFDGLNVLTDPIWSERSSPFSWIGPKRVRPPGVRFEDLPPIDLVVVSHDHYDHCDLPTLKRLADAHRPTFLVPLAVASLLRDEGIAPVHERDWWQSIAYAQGRRAWVVPAQHFAARGPFDRDERLWGGFVLETQGGPVYFAGDTAYSEHFAQIRERFGPMRLAVLPIGAYLPRWFMKPVHIDPREAVAAHRDLAANVSVGMHYGTFHLADEAQDQAADDLHEALADEPDVTFWTLGFGEGRAVPPRAR